MPIAREVLECPECGFRTTKWYDDAADVTCPRCPPEPPADLPDRLVDLDNVSGRRFARKLREAGFDSPEALWRASPNEVTGAFHGAQQAKLARLKVEVGDPSETDTMAMERVGASVVPRERMYHRPD